VALFNRKINIVLQFNRPLSSTFLFLVLLTSAGTTCLNVTAQELSPEEQRLRTIEQELKSSEAEKARLQQRQDAAQREAAALRTSMVALAKDIQDQEYSLNILESRLADLEKEETKLKSTLGLRDEQMQRVAMAIQRLALRPSDAVSLSPLKPDDAVRTAILLRAAIPEVRASAKNLEGELGKLYGVRAEMEGQQQKIALATAGLIDRRRTLEGQEQEKAKLHLELTAATSEASAKLQRLAAEASDMKDLVAKVIAGRAAEAKRLEAARQAEAAKAPRIVLKAPPGTETAQPKAPIGETKGGETKVAALPSQPARTPPKPPDLRPFSDARGTMPFPAVGTLKRRYGEGSDDPNALNKGIVIAARAGGQVVAPFDGVVAFAGPFRGYGLLLIIEHSEGYHTLLAGLGRIDCVMEQRIFAGEPIGVMTNDSTTDLYVELRQNGQPINPLPWLASRTVGKSNG